ncbi:MAG: hypothetical protein REJ23_09130 [Brevundimonas sp.]|nr:hypothetical protein [Brevundimonas sp.]
MPRPRQPLLTMVALLLLVLFLGLFIGYRIGADQARRDNAIDQSIRPEVASLFAPAYGNRSSAAS